MRVEPWKEESEKMARHVAAQVLEAQAARTEYEANMIRFGIKTILTMLNPPEGSPGFKDVESMCEAAAKLKEAQAKIARKTVQELREKGAGEGA